MIDQNALLEIHSLKHCNTQVRLTDCKADSQANAALADALHVAGLALHAQVSWSYLHIPDCIVREPLTQATCTEQDAAVLFSSGCNSSDFGSTCASILPHHLQVHVKTNCVDPPPDGKHTVRRLLRDPGAACGSQVA